MKQTYYTNLKNMGKKKKKNLISLLGREYHLMGQFLEIILAEYMVGVHTFLD
jgi:hypothetical protein